MDRRACLWANRLLGNDPRAPVLEIALGGFSLTFESAATVALTGADCRATVGGAAVGNWRTASVREGDTLRLAYSATGMRAYLAFPGGLRAEKAFGSASGVARDGLQGLLGRALRAGERIEWLDPSAGRLARRVPAAMVPRPPPPAGAAAEVPFVRGYEWDEFSRADRQAFLDTEWEIEPASDRVATKLSGPSLESGPRVLDSAPLVDGTVQVTGSGRPLVFMRDRPTIGGYAKLGAVDPLALDGLAQARSGTAIRFVPGQPARMREEMARHERFFGLSR